MAWRSIVRFRVALCVMLVACIAGACKSRSNTTPPAPSPTVHADVLDDTSGAVSEPAITDLRAQQEILLHASLYRAAFLARVGDAHHFILEPVSEAFPPNLGVDPADFRSRVLEQLADVQSPVAWAPSTWRTQMTDVFPGTNERATRLTARIISRDEDQATVTAEIGDHTLDSLSSRQTVSATWDGKQWQMERGRARVVW
jgi:hypothetical protein